MDLQEIITLLGTLLGVLTPIGGVSVFMYRKQGKRLKNTEVALAEANVEKAKMESRKDQITLLSDMNASLIERNDKLVKMNAEKEDRHQQDIKDWEERFTKQTEVLRTSQRHEKELADEVIRLTEENGRLKVELEKKRCDDLNCAFRLPPNAYTPPKKDTTKDEYFSKITDRKTTDMKILIDNGHGVTTPGKRSPDGVLREYKYCRIIAFEVVSRLKALGFDAELLVPEDADISLGERCNRANAWCTRLGAKNVCLVSIHLNAAGNGSQWMNARGWEAWTSVGQTQGDKLADCLYDAAQKYLPTGTKIRTDTTDGDRDKESNFTILYRSRCAACLTENMFQDNREDVAWLQSPQGREAIVTLHVEGIKEYVRKYGTK